jgi:hypothetical protein
MAKQDIELALDAASMRRMQQGMDKYVGNLYWKGVEQTGKRTMKTWMQTQHQVSRKSSDNLYNSLDDVYKRSSKRFSNLFEDAIHEGSDLYQDSMKRAIDKISKLQSKTESARQQAVDAILENEMKALDKRLHAEKEIDALRGKGSLREKMKSSMGGGEWGGKAAKAGNSLKSWGAAATGSGMSGVGSMMGSAGGMVGAAGPLLAVGAALGVLAKKALEVVDSVNGMNKSMIAGSGAADVFAAGYDNVQTGINDMRSAFTEAALANYEWRLTAEQSMDALNNFAANGMRVADVQKEMGISAGEAAREMVTVSRAYSTLMGVDMGTVTKMISDMTQEMGQSFGSTIEALATINTYAARSGMSVSAFFGKVQSLNSQVGLLNSSLKAQAKILADSTEGATFGVERASKAVGDMMGKMDFDKALILLNQSGNDGLKVAQMMLASVKEKLRSDDLDEGARKRLEAAQREIVQALQGGEKEMADLFTSGLTDGIGEMGLTFAAIAKVLGKDIQTLRSGDLQVALTKEQVLELQQLAGLGSDSEVREVMLTSADMLAKNGTALETIKAAYAASTDKDMSVQISEEMQIAKDQLAMTESATMILTNIKELIYEKIYDLMFSMYKLMIKTAGSDQDKMVLKFDEAMKYNEGQIQKASKANDGAEAIRLSGVQEALRAERGTLLGSSDDQVEQYVKNYGGGDVNRAADRRIGSGFIHGGQAGELTGNKGAPAPTAIMETSDENKTRMQAAKAHSANVKARQDRDAQVIEAQNRAAKALLETKSIYHQKLIADNSQKEWDALANSNPQFRHHQSIIDLLMASQKGLIDPEMADNAMESGELMVPAMADGGIVTKPTIALIGEDGKEAIIPLDKGGMMGEFHMHIHGNIYGVEDLKKTVSQGLKAYERSRRV